MLTGYQCDVVAYYIADAGGYLCGACAARATSMVAVARAERGLSTGYGLSPVIRYALDGVNGERAYEYAEETADRWIAEHPTLAARLLGEDNANYSRLIDHIAERAPGECCEDCGAELK